MATLEIGGRRVEVDDSFRNLSPEEQQRTVDEIASSFGQRPQAAATAEQPGLLQQAGEAVSDFGHIFKNQGLSFNLGDEAFGALATPIEMGIGAYTGEHSGMGLGERISAGYQSARDAYRERDAAARERSPVASTAGEILGGVLAGGGAAKSGLTLLNAGKATIPGMMARGAGEGAAYGALHGFGSGEGIEDSLRGAAMGGTVGGVTGSAIGGLAGKLAQRGAIKTLPSTADLKKTGDALYTAARKSGVGIKPGAVRQGVADIRQAMDDVGYDYGIHPKVARALTRLEETAKSGKPVDFGMFDRLRRIAGSAAKSNEADERRVASILIEKMDDFADSLTAAHVDGGDPQVAVSLLKTARKIWSSKAKAETIENIIEGARDTAGNYSQSGMDNALRQGFKALARNKKALRGFSKDEIAAIKAVSRGGPTQNILRWMGKMAPRGVVSGGFNVGVGAVGGPLAGIGTVVAGEAGRAGSAAMRMSNAKLAEAIMRSGGNMPTPRLTGPQEALIRALITGSAQESPKAFTGR